MSDFTGGVWSYYIAIIAIVGIIFCVWLLFTQRSLLRKDAPVTEDTGHVWDGNLTELNHPVPRWWTVMYLGLCVFGVLYLVLYPGLGSYKGLLAFSSAQEVKDDQAAMRSSMEPVYARFRDLSIEQVSQDADARRIGQRLFLNNCAQCHGSDARGGAGFPNLADGDWLWGGDPAQIQHSITEGRHGIMPPWRDQVGAGEAADIAQYVRSLSGLASDPLRVVRGKKGFDTYCVACHGAEGKGNPLLGAPNLTDANWLYGSSEASIVDTILNGRQNQMPAQKGLLTDDQIRMLTAWVWGLSNRPATVAVTTQP